jgi:hypothetical protein
MLLGNVLSLGPINRHHNEPNGAVQNKRSLAHFLRSVLTCRSPAGHLRELRLISSLSLIRQAWRLYFQLGLLSYRTLRTGKAN